MLELFQSVWSYVNSCCGLLLDAAGMKHSYQYERPAVPPSPEQCAAFLPELGANVQTLTLALQRLMKLSVVSLKADNADLLAVWHCLRTLMILAGQETGLLPRQLLHFIKGPANRVLLGKGLDQMVDFLHSLQGLQHLVS
ncbi:uncharacterized protein LOC119101815 [Pollicipes pollicipes]|uniref:uncharacterized protein LOC119101815 n=1 Tax=Pollicipes pollicipes TaxID=41117 RepID=UPI001885680F|nr:uncharacterized protein LOC119101815 [Pollicipes pollicipes]